MPSTTWPATAITVDAQGNSFFVGSYQQTASFGLNNVLTAVGEQDLFVAKLGQIQALGAEEGVSASQQVSVYPNPFATGFTVEFTAATVGKADVILYDVLGRQIFSSGYQTTIGKQELQIMPDSHLPQGVYLLQLQAEGAVRLLRVLKQ